MNRKIYTLIAVNSGIDYVKCGSLKEAEALRWKVI